MALYNNGYPVTYPYQQLYQQPQFQQQMSAQPQIQNSGFIPVSSETDARNYPVAPGNSVTFKDEKLPYVYVKTMGFSQLDRPVFEKFRLVKEQEMPPEASESILRGSEAEANKIVDYVKQDEIKPILGDIRACQENITTLEKDMEELREQVAVLISRKGRSNEHKHNTDD